jgi:hypothetical protein
MLEEFGFNSSRCNMFSKCWAPSSLLWSRSDSDMKLTTHIHLVLKLRMGELYLRSQKVFMPWFLINEVQGSLCLLPYHGKKFYRWWG